MAATDVVVEQAAARATGRGQAVSRRVSKSLWPLGTIVATVLVWQIISWSGAADPIIFPAPLDVFRAAIDMLGADYFWQATSSTMQVTLFGFAVGVVGAWILGTLIGMFERLRLSVYPLAIAFQNLPRIALGPLFLTWFGFGLSGKIVLAATLCFFPVLLNVVVGTDQVDPDSRRVLRSYGATRWQEYRRLTFPSSLPLLFAGMKTAVTLALTGAIVSEFVGGSDGMGVLIKNLNFQLEIAAGFAVIILLSLIGLVLYGVMEVIERYAIRWRRPSTA